MAAIAVASCGEASPPGSAPLPLFAAPRAGPADEPGARLRAAIAADDPQALVRALAPSWAEIQRLGDHRLVTEITVDQRPELIPQPPPVDRPIVRPLAVTEQTELWVAAADPSAPLRWSASGPLVRERARPHPSVRMIQRTEQGSRGFVVHEGRTWSRRDDGPWRERPWTEGELEPWFQEAHRAIADALELGAPRLGWVERLCPEPANEGCVRLELSAGPARALASAPAPRAAWRGAAELDAIDGWLELDLEAGTWRRVELELRYRYRGSTGPVAGRLELRGALERGPIPPIEPPAEALPEPLRERRELDRRALLDELAAAPLRERG